MNPYAFEGASPSSWCVCQFRHPRKGGTTTRFYYFLTGAGVAGAGADGVLAGAFAGADWVVGALFSSTEPVPPTLPLRVARTERLIEVIMNRIAAMVVARERAVAAPRGPKAVWLPMPPKAPARSAALPLCSNTTRIKNKQTITCTVVSV